MASQKQNEWVCRYCDTHNEAYRGQCKTCGQPKPSSRNNQKILIIVLVCIIVLLACILIGILLVGKSSPVSEPKPTAEVTATPAPKATPKPTATPRPTSTPQPISTPQPTETPEPTPIPTPSATPAPKATPTPTPVSATPTPTETIIVPSPSFVDIPSNPKSPYGQALKENLVDGVYYSDVKKANKIGTTFDQRKNDNGKYKSWYFGTNTKNIVSGCNAELYFADGMLFFINITDGKNSVVKLYYWAGNMIACNDYRGPDHSLSYADSEVFNNVISEFGYVYSEAMNYAP